MEVSLTPKLPKRIYAREGGLYYSWTASELPMLLKANVAASKLILEPCGLALPHYSDSTKIGYIEEGKGRLGILLTGSTKEKVIGLKKGDVVVVPSGVISWLLNDGDSALTILFLGDTSKAHHSAEFTDFYLTGPNGIFTGFSTEFATRAWDVDEELADKLLRSQNDFLIINIKDVTNMPEPSESDSEGLSFSCEAAVPDIDVENGGRVVVLTSANMPLLKDAGFSADFVKLDGNAMCSPAYSSDAAFQVTYIARGSGRVQIVGVHGRRVLDTKVTAGFLFIVPRFLTVSKIADAEGMEWFSMVTSPIPVFNHLAGKTAPWKALSPQILQVSLNVSPDAEEQLRSKRDDDAVFFPPPS